MADLKNIWSCPYCNSSFDNDFFCKSCNISFPIANNRPDLRIKKPKNITLEYNYIPEFGYFPWEIATLEWPSGNNGLTRQKNWDNTEFSMLQSVPKTDKASGYMALDIGCGENRQRFKEGLEMLGYIPVGIDIDGPAPDALADAHCLPFKNETFDVIMSSAVFEHLKNPFAAMKELYRVAKPNAKIFLSIAYNEPFHISYFHHSQLAAHELLVTNNIHPDKIILSADWNSFNANLLMGYAGYYMPKFLQNLISKSIMNFSLLPARIKGILKNDPEHIKKAKLAFARSHSGAIGVIAHK